MTIMNVTASSLISSDLSLVQLVIEHNILPKGGHQDELNKLLFINMYYLQDNIKFNLPLWTIWNIGTIVPEGVKVDLLYRVMLSCIFRYFKIPLDGQTSLKSTPFDELTFRRMGDDIGQSSYCRSQSGERDKVHKGVGSGWICFGPAWRTITL